MENKYKVLFVCHGNICRSPMAEFIFKALVKAHGAEDYFHIESAAVSSEEIGSGIYPPAKRCLKVHGISYSEAKTARKVTAADYDNFDLILCMDRSNIRRIRRIIPEDPANKIHLMMSCVNMANAYMRNAGAEADGYAWMQDAGADGYACLHDTDAKADGFACFHDAGAVSGACLQDAGAEADGYACFHDAGAECAPDVADPWYTGDFETTFQDLLLSCEALLSSLLSAPLSSRPR